MKIKLPIIITFKPIHFLYTIKVSSNTIIKSIGQII